MWRSISEKIVQFFKKIYTSCDILQIYLYLVEKLYNVQKYTNMRQVAVFDLFSLALLGGEGI